MYSKRDEGFGKIQRYSSCEREQRKNVVVLGIATGPSLNRSEKLPISSQYDESYYRWHQMLNGQYIKNGVNSVSNRCR
jgi:hypothetical protein